MDKITVPAGRYFLGDPCYCFSTRWSEVLERSKYFDDVLKEGRRFAMAFNTTHGDGTYLDGKGMEYPVDAGMIGLVSVVMAEINPGKASRIVRFKQPTECFTEGGKLHFGDIVIDTDPRDVEDRNDMDGEE